MSGVFGYFGSKQPALAVAGKMGARMRHYDYMRADAMPLGAGADNDDRGAFGRLTIGLFNQEPQPVCGAGGAVALCLTGEFYHQEPRRAQMVAAGALAPDASDADLALAMYLQEGAAGLARLEGAFVVAVWDQRTRELLLVNDRFGLYPHYYAHHGSTFCYAPEIKALLCAPGLPRKLDMTAIAEYTRFQQMLGERTWIEGVQLLPPATILRYRQAQNALELTRYWDWDAIQPHTGITFNEAVDETVRLFQRAIDAMTKPPLRAGVYLSGGLDGRTILGFVDKNTPLHAITYGEAGCRDVLYGARLAQRAGRPHRWFPFDKEGKWVLDHVDMHQALTEGMHGWMHSHGMNTLAGARALIDVNLSGWDGGTVMGGRIGEYESDYLLRHAADEETLIQRNYEGFCQDFTWPGLTDDEEKMLFRHPGRNELIGRARASFGAAFARTAHYASPYRADFFYVTQHVRRSTQAMLVFQRAACEVRTPFFDYDLVSFLYSLPEEIYATPALHRAVLTRRAPALALVPHEKDDSLPHANLLVRGGYAALEKGKRVINRIAANTFPDRPRLYADYEHYLRADLRAWSEGILFDGRLNDRQVYDPSMVRVLWERHQRGDQLWTIGKIAPIISMELVIRALLDETSREPCAF